MHSFFLIVLFFFSLLPAHGLGADDRVPEFEVRLLDGNSVGSRDLGGSVTVIDFWAVWCGPCIMEIPDYNKFYRKYQGRGVKFLAMAMDSGSEDDVRQAVQKFKMEYPVATLTPEQVEAFNILVLPTTWILDQQGRVVKQYLGVPRDKHQTMERIVEKLLQSE